MDTKPPTSRTTTGRTADLRGVMAIVVVVVVTVVMAADEATGEDRGGSSPVVSGQLSGNSKAPFE